MLRLPRGSFHSFKMKSTERRARSRIVKRVERPVRAGLGMMGPVYAWLIFAVGVSVVDAPRKYLWFQTVVDGEPMGPLPVVCWLETGSQCLDYLSMETMFELLYWAMILRAFRSLHWWNALEAYGVGKYAEYFAWRRAMDKEESYEYPQGEVF